MRKGIILAGGSGSRLSPLTDIISKQLLPIYDKPMIYYPLTTLMLGGIRDILLISTPGDTPKFIDLLGDGSQWGINLEYAIQERPEGLAQAFIIGRKFLNGGPSCLVLGDNVFFGSGLSEKLLALSKNRDATTVFAYEVNDPQRYGVVEFDDKKTVLSLEEKPLKPKSNFAITGLYFYDNCASEFASELVPSPRGELEITDLNKRYLEIGKLNVDIFGRGYAWLDTGTVDSLLEASSFIAHIQNRQGVLVASPEEVAWRMGWINATAVDEKADQMKNSSYGLYLKKLIK